MTSAGVFDEYAAWYDAFNEGKDYAAETKYLLEQVERWRPIPRSWLDVGCGTGNHLAVLASCGISTEGVDTSQAMIDQARLAHPDIPFHVGLAEEFHLSGQRDVVSMLFHVLSYQTSDAAIRQTIHNVAAHLAPNGVFVFDFWNTEGLLLDPPATRMRQTRIGDRTLWRISRPAEDRRLRRVDIRFEFRWDSPEGPLTHEEVHSMRYFTANELAGFLMPAGLNILSCEGWMTRRPLAPRDWYGLICSGRSAADAGKTTLLPEKTIMSAERSNRPPASNGGYEGSHDFADSASISGWARSLSNPEEPVRLDIFADGKLIGTVRSDRFRQDLLDAGKGDGRCAFAFQVPFRLHDGRTHSIWVKVSGTDVALAHTPKEIRYAIERLPRHIMEEAARITATARSTPLVEEASARDRYRPSRRKVHIVCYEDVDEWILGKIARRLCDGLASIGMEVSLGKEPIPSADINHHIIYWGYVDKKTTIETVMITHIDIQGELGKVRRQLVDVGVEMGICMSFEAVNRLAHFGIPREKLCFVNPAHDNVMKPRKTLVGLTTRLYPDGCKREHLLQELAGLISPDDFKFAIMGAGWDRIVQALRDKGFEVDYLDRFDYTAYCHLIPSLDYYLYLGQDEGSAGFIDALTAGIPTIVTPQGYHLDAPGGITYPFVTLNDLERVFNEIAEQKQKRVRAVSSWTWAENARQHALIWDYLLLRKAGNCIPQSMSPELSKLAVLTT